MKGQLVGLWTGRTPSLRQVRGALQSSAAADGGGSAPSLGPGSSNLWRGRSCCPGGAGGGSLGPGVSGALGSDCSLADAGKLKQSWPQDTALGSRVRLPKDPSVLRRKAMEGVRLAGFLCVLSSARQQTAVGKGCFCLPGRSKRVVLVRFQKTHRGPAPRGKGDKRRACTGCSASPPRLSEGEGTRGSPDGGTRGPSSHPASWVSHLFPQPGCTCLLAFLCLFALVDPAGPLMISGLPGQRAGLPGVLLWLVASLWALLLISSVVWGK